jgi:hypothetical protein
MDNVSRKRLPIAYTARESRLSSGRSVACFRRCELRNDIVRESALGNRGASYCLGGSAASGACSLWM